MLAIGVSRWLEPLPGPRKQGTRGAHVRSPRALGAVEEDTCRFFFGADSIVGADRAIVKLVVVEVDLKERGAIADLAGDEGFRQRVFDVALQSAAQGTCPVAAIDEPMGTRCES